MQALKVLKGLKLVLKFIFEEGVCKKVLNWVTSKIEPALNCNNFSILSSIFLLYGCLFDHQTNGVCLPIHLKFGKKIGL